MPLNDRWSSKLSDHMSPTYINYLKLVLIKYGPPIHVQYVECIGHVNEWHSVINQSKSWFKCIVYGKGEVDL